MSLRVAARSLKPTLHRAAYQHARTVAHRQFASNSHNAPEGNDTAWIIGSALVFIPTIGYLLSPSAHSKPHQAHSATGHGKPHAPAENTPTGAAPPPPPPPAEPTKNEETIADAEGTEIPVEEVKASVVQAVTHDAPKEAAQAEAETAESTKDDDGASSQNSEAETDREQTDKPHDEPKKDTVHNAESRPTELGKAQEKAVQGKVPKQAASSGGSK